MKEATLIKRLSDVRCMAGHIRNRCNLLNIDEYHTLHKMIKDDVNTERKSWKNSTSRNRYHISAPAQVDDKIVSVVSEAFALIDEPQNIIKQLEQYGCSKYLPVAIHLAAVHRRRMSEQTVYASTMLPIDMDELHKSAKLIDWREISTLY